MKRPKSNKTQRISVRVTEKEKDKLEEYAFDQEVSVGQVVRKALKLYLGGLLDDMDEEPDNFDD